MELYNYIFITIAGLLLILVLHDVFQKKHTILRIFPVVGHLRYLLEKIGPELRQYWVANDKEEMPFTRSERSWIYATSKKENNNFGFGSSELMYETGYPVLKHSAFPTKDKYDACGYHHPCQFTGKDIEISTGVNMFDPLEKIIGYEKVTIPTEELNNILKY